MPAAIIRILLRYAAGPLILYGLISPEEATDIINDPDIHSYVGIAFGLLSPLIAEGWYALAKRFGWRT
ncbi:hypothetical protein ACQQ2Q_21495 [Agrobacterium sp. ES01]|uniref:hypothetical protein n=1 Tax=Agrobacterium sp. ES01 TaxID=3420714 RepID=UPI003D0A5A71